MKERTDFMILSLGDGAAGNDEEIFAGCGSDSATPLPHTPTLSRWEREAVRRLEIVSHRGAGSPGRAGERNLENRTVPPAGPSPSRLRGAPERRFGAAAARRG